ncbi:hypothetical protein D5F01_LYC24031 [Larimichthys crocea]|uniref:Uncharacterized protein n=1 Tax=Larimichthys crocea TaxID=215358 RepID=A0A6G0HFQ9_LARCR|nr:hypothetical protein D5F01_LYC24031 [Larimichthys crocea]
MFPSHLRLSRRPSALPRSSQRTTGPRDPTRRRSSTFLASFASSAASHAVEQVLCYQSSPSLRTPSFLPAHDRPPRPDEASLLHFPSVLRLVLLLLLLCFPPIFAFLAVPPNSLVRPSARPAPATRRGVAPPLSTRPSPRPSTSTPMFPSHLRLSRRPSELPRSSQRTTGPRDPTRRRSSTFHSSFASSFYFYSYVSLPSSPFSPSLRTPSFVPAHDRPLRPDEASLLHFPLVLRLVLLLLLLCFPPIFAFLAVPPHSLVPPSAPPAPATRRGVAPPLSTRPSPRPSTSTPMFPSHLRLSRRPSELPRSSQRTTGPRDPTRRRSSTFHSSFASSFYFYSYVSLPSSPFSPSLRTPSFVPAHDRPPRPDEASLLHFPLVLRLVLLLLLLCFPPIFAFLAVPPNSLVPPSAPPAPATQRGVAPPLSTRPSPRPSNSTPMFPSHLRLSRRPSELPRSSQRTTGPRDPMRRRSSTFHSSFASSFYFYSYVSLPSSPFSPSLRTPSFLPAHHRPPRPDEASLLHFPLVLRLVLLLLLLCFPPIFAFLAVPPNSLVRPSARPAPRDPTRRRSSTFHSSFASSFYFYSYVSLPSSPFSPSLRTPSFVPAHDRPPRPDEASLLHFPLVLRLVLLLLLLCFPPIFAFLAVPPHSLVPPSAPPAPATRRGVAPPLSTRPSPRPSTSTPMFPSHLRLSRRPSELPRSSQRTTGPRDPTRRRSSTFHSSFASSFYFYSYVSLPSSPFSPSLRTPSFVPAHDRPPRPDEASLLHFPLVLLLLLLCFPPIFAFLAVPPHSLVPPSAPPAPATRRGVAPPLSTRPSPRPSTSTPMFPSHLRLSRRPSELPRSSQRTTGPRDPTRRRSSTFHSSFASSFYFYSYVSLPSSPFSPSLRTPSFLPAHHRPPRPDEASLLHFPLVLRLVLLLLLLCFPPIFAFLAVPPNSLVPPSARPAPATRRGVAPPLS